MGGERIYRGLGACHPSTPERMEIVRVNAATEASTGEILLANRQIYRPAEGGGRLLPLVYEKRKTLFVMDKS